ncbi:MAG: DUF1028 domain-containing protein [Armatimonadetes bacterium]|nr:DUF1028 domain-containing protein [Armatimonadota bacterium]
MSQHADPLAHTFSIVARDPHTGEMGVAVQSHAFSVGYIVPWGESGVGVVATQAMSLMDYGPRGVASMRDGISAPDALARLIAEDDGRDVRQVAMLDASGRAAAHTGSRTLPAAGHLTQPNLSVQGNILASPRVWEAMHQAFLRTGGPLVDRLVAALVAAQAAGGDARGVQSAAILVVEGRRLEKPWTGRIFELRVENHPLPIDELARVIELRKAALALARGQQLTNEGHFEEAEIHLDRALAIAPDEMQTRFWVAVAHVAAGRTERAMTLFRDVFAAEPHWAGLVPRMVRAGRLPEEPALIARILSRSQASG